MSHSLYTAVNHLLRLGVLFVFTGILSMPSHAGQPADSSLSQAWPPASIATPSLTLVLEGKVTLEPRIAVGNSDAGQRGVVPITGGEFRGKNGFKATVRPGGADWQLSRIDGVTELTAIYLLVTDDGENIIVENRGIGVTISDAEGKDSKGNSAYVASNPRFHAPQGKYEWLNKKQFVGTVEPAEDLSYVMIRVFEVVL